MTDIRSPRLLYLKAGLFVLLSFTASILLLILAPDWRIAALLAIVIWAFCRAYYFAFYVVQHYIDNDFRFAGLWDFAKYAIKRRCK